MVMDWFLLYSFLDAYIEQPWKWKIMVLVWYFIGIVWYWYGILLVYYGNGMVSALLYLEILSLVMVW